MFFGGEGARFDGSKIGFDGTRNTARFGHEVFDKAGFFAWVNP